MKLLKWKSQKTDSEKIYETKTVEKKDWKGNVIGTEIITTNKVISIKDYYNEFAQSVDGVWKFEHLSKIKFDQYSINGCKTTAEEYDRVMQELEAL